MSSLKMSEVNVTSQTNNNLNQRVIDTIHAIITTDCEKYPSK